jgi:hypothetical protein
VSDGFVEALKLVPFDVGFHILEGHLISHLSNLVLLFLQRENR